MAHELPVLTNSEDITQKLNAHLTQPETAEAFLVDLDAGLLRFSHTIFSETDSDHVYAQKFQREPEGTGPHFDLHGDFVGAQHPWISVYNLSGSNAIRAVRLPDDLLKSYLETYPEPDDAAFEARRHFGAIALGSSRLDVAEGIFEPNMGLVLPQTPNGPQIVHEITPTDADNPGEFIKLTTVADSNAEQELRGYEYISLDELVTKALGGIIRKQGTEQDIEAPNDIPGLVRAIFEPGADYTAPTSHDTRGRRRLPRSLRSRYGGYPPFGRRID